MQNRGLKYFNYDVVFQEVPDEVTLAFNVTNCPYMCDECHSPYLRNNVGNYLCNDMGGVLARYKDMITCVCFMGGDQDKESLIYLLGIVRQTYKLKTCLYTGTNDIDDLDNVIQYLDYIKIGAYRKELGGLNSQKTNQRFYKISGKTLSDLTYSFQNKNEVI